MSKYILQRDYTIHQLILHCINNKSLATFVKDLIIDHIELKGNSYLAVADLCPFDLKEFTNYIFVTDGRDFSVLLECDQNREISVCISKLLIEDLSQELGDTICDALIEYYTETMQEIIDYFTQEIVADYQDDNGCLE